MPGASAIFDRFAPTYDESWTNTPVGRLQRDAVWRHIEGLFKPGDHVLDLGCGTGEDSLWLMRRAVAITAIDASPGMVQAARQRGVNAQVMRIEDLRRMATRFDGAISNFGPLNCLESFDEFRSALTRIVRPGGKVALCLIGRFCLWETLAYAAQGRFAKAGRRWSGRNQSPSMGFTVAYPSVRAMRRAMAREFTLEKVIGIGIAVPPSFVQWIPQPVLRSFAAIDRLIEGVPLIRGLSDHRLLIFSRR
jgi:ubiquinone/menaquinone biosynthesis C-methylase UbiE